MYRVALYVDDVLPVFITLALTLAVSPTLISPGLISREVTPNLAGSAAVWQAADNINVIITGIRAPANIFFLLFTDFFLVRIIFLAGTEESGSLYFSCDEIIPSKASR